MYGCRLARADAEELSDELWIELHAFWPTTFVVAGAAPWRQYPCYLEHGRTSKHRPMLCSRISGCAAGILPL